MIKHWAKLSCLLACSQILAIACTTEDDDEPTTTTTGTTNTGGSGGSTTGTTSSGGGSAGESSGGSAGEAATTSTVNTTGSSAGAAGMAGDAGAGGAGEPVRVSDLIGLEDGEFHDGAKPDTSGYDGTEISEITGPDTVTNGGTFTINVTVPGATGDMTFVVAVEGDSGHFTTTATAGEGGVFEIAISLNADVDLETFTVSVAPTDAEGDVGEYRDAAFDLLESGTGDVKVTLSFDQSTDLDLMVLEPSGNEINADYPESSSGGTLDLDSNGFCDPIDGTNIENIFWPEAPEGEYVVKVGYFQACVPDPVNFTVTITVGDAVTTVSGTFVADDAGFRRTVASFTVD